MAYLSRIPINPLRSSGREMFRNPHETHKRVAQAIASSEPERLLWRLDYRGTRAELLVLSRSRPAWVCLVDEAGWPGADNGEARIADYLPLLNLLQRGREFTFRVRANPVQSVKQPQSAGLQKKLEARGDARPRGVRVPHRTAAQQQEWFLHRSRGWGFEVASQKIEGFDEAVPNLAITERKRFEFSKHPTSRGKGPRVTLATAVFEGVLRVDDPEILAGTLLNGLGPAKGYGCGLLTLAPVR